ncbi:MAG: cation-transporting P-type ATPase, partial [Nitrospiraceae bacterium]|nr:cation-transporting P-type ATPase [Nitrospiraceae bacterium]
LTAVSLAVAAIPEGLPAVITLTLAVGVTAMVKRHVIIRRLAAIETLGATTVICTDKTGTLTKNEMTVTCLYVDGRRFDVSGEGYAPTGDIVEAGTLGSSDEGGLHALLSAAVLCNEAGLRQDQGIWKVVGDPTEGALLVAAAKRRIWKEQLETEQSFLGEVPFDPQRKMMTVVRKAGREAMVYVKGAPDVLLRHCVSGLTTQGPVAPLRDDERQSILKTVDTLAHRALRVMGIARPALKDMPVEFRSKDLERRLVFIGLAAMRDPLRPEAKHAVLACRNAGIRTVMITGDHNNSAAAIGRELTILNGDAVLEGTELDQMSDSALSERVDRIAVCARVSAEHKLRIIRAWKARGAIVAMTGDGVNDAPAVKEADIGVAMGLTGTDATKEAADMVVTDDNFASIVAAVEAWRGIYENMLKAIQYLLSGNLGEVLVMLFTVVLGVPLPLIPVQILWINLVTDSLPALALSVDPPDSHIMRRPPRRVDEDLVNRDRLSLLFGQGVFMALVTLCAFLYCFSRREDSLDQSRTVAFTVLMVAHLTNALNCRSNESSLFSLGLWTNPMLLCAVAGSLLLHGVIVLIPWAQAIFKTTDLSPEQWMLIAVLGFSPLPAMELWKYLRRSTASHFS